MAEVNTLIAKIESNIMHDIYIIEGEVEITAKCTYNKNNLQIIYYRFQMSTDGKNWTSDTGPTTSNKITYNITRIARGKTFYFRAKVIAYNGEESKWSDTISYTSNSAPTEPVLTGKNLGIDKIELQWTESEDKDQDIDNYMLYINNELFKNGNFIGIQYDISNDPEGQEYNFYILVRDYFGVEAKSNTLTMYKGTRPTNVEIFLDKENIAEKEVELYAKYKCGHSLGNIYYKYAYKLSSETKWIELGWNINSTAIINLENFRGKSIDFKVKLKNAIGESDWSSIKSIVSNTLPPTPINLIYDGNFIDNLILKWDIDNNIYNKDITYNVYLQIDNGNFFMLKSTKDKQIEYERYEYYISGTEFKFKVESVDEFGASSFSKVSESFIKPYPPSAASFIYPENTIVENKITIEWEKSNFYQSKNGIYELLIYHNNEIIDTITVNKSTNKAIIDLSNIDRGDKVKIKLSSINDFNQKTEALYELTLKRNSLPSSPVITNPTDLYFSNIFNIKWDRSYDKDNQIITYEIYISKNEEDYIYIGSTNNENYTWADSNNKESDTYRIKIKAIDESGGSSYIIGKLLKKWIKPYDPILINQNQKYFEDSITIKWDDKKNYGKIKYYYLNIIVGTFKDCIILNGDTTSYTYSLKQKERGGKISYNIVAEDIYNVRSDIVSSTEEMFINKIPNDIYFSLPLNKSKVFSKTPKIIIKNQTDKSDEDQENIIKIMYNNNIYDTKNHPQYFSRKNVLDNTYTIFKCDIPLPLGENVIKICSNDGLINGNIKSLIINVLESINLNSNNLVSANDYIKIKNAIDTTRISYGMNKIPTDYNIIKNDTIIYKTYYNTLINKLNDLTKKIDSYHYNNKFKYEKINNINNNIIKEEDINSINDTINNI